MNKEQMQQATDSYAAYRDNKMWELIESYDYNTHGYKNAAERFNELEVDKETIKELQSFTENKMSRLYDLYADDLNIGSDDGMSDLFAQVVANGEEFYENANLDSLQTMYDNFEYKESFKYIFLEW